MKQYSADFSSFEQKIWLNAASEGPLPIAAQKELSEAMEWKSKPYELTLARFSSVPRELKKSIARLIEVNEEDVILANSASYGLYILANGIDWHKGDEILVMQNDFPTNILPWLALEEKGVCIRQIQAEDKILTPEELLANVTARTRLFCISHVHTFTGYECDVLRLGEICQAKGIIFVLNVSQSAGTMPVDIGRLPVDAVVCAGYKWLCGPYGTGFFWMKSELRNSLEYNQVYWTLLPEEVLQGENKLVLPQMNNSRKYDVFGTANFFNFKPFRAAIDYWLKIGMQEVQGYHSQLIDTFIDGLNHDQYYLISPTDKEKRSSLVVLSHRRKEKNQAIHQKLKSQGIYTAFWKGHLRIAPHVYNTSEEINKLINELNRIPSP